MNSCLAVITARGGSKRIPRKNIKLFHGKPIIAYSIKAAFDSGCFDTVMVSTDDEEIASIALSYGAKVPFFRSKETSNDFATTASVVAEVLRELEMRNKNFIDVCCIYPTAPFLTGEKILQAYEALIQSGAKTLLSVVRFEYPVQRSLRMQGDSLSYWMPEFRDARSQDIEPMFHDAGQMYWLHGQAFLQSGSFVTDNTIGFELPETEVQDIDTDADWKIAELKYEIMTHLSVT